MSGNYLLDTNIVIALFAGEQPVLDQLKNASEVYIPSIVIGELYYGANKSSRKSNNFQRIEALIADSVVLACDAVTAFHYGSVKEELDKRGNLFPKMISG